MLEFHQSSEADQWNCNWRSNICVTAVLEREEKDGGAEKYWGKNSWKFPKFGGNINLHIQEAE